ncbi:MAG: hypothetical protein M1818_003035, partial [Claussenomyces sp. TS43310]
SDTAAWIGFPQSFLDEDQTSEGGDKLEVDRSDLLRIRNNFRPNTILPRFPWQPPGRVDARHVEIELWPRLQENGCRRKYLYWKWWLGTRDHRTFSIEKGYRYDKHSGSCHPKAESGTLVSAVLRNSRRITPDILLEPSKAATACAMQWIAETASGDYEYDSTLYDHPWLADLRRESNNEVVYRKDQESDQKEDESQALHNLIHSWIVQTEDCLDRNCHEL